MRYRTSHRKKAPLSPQWFQKSPGADLLPSPAPEPLSPALHKSLGQEIQHLIKVLVRSPALGTGRGESASPSYRLKIGAYLKERVQGVVIGPEKGVHAGQAALYAERQQAPQTYFQWKNTLHPG